MNDSIAVADTGCWVRSAEFIGNHSVTLKLNLCGDRWSNIAIGARGEYPSAGNFFNLNGDFPFFYQHNGFINGMGQFPSFNLQSRITLGVHNSMVKVTIDGIQLQGEWHVPVRWCIFSCIWRSSSTIAIERIVI